jgi:hypothetical protein
VVEAPVFGMLLHLLLYHEPIREFSVAPGSIIKTLRVGTWWWKCHTHV